MPNGLFPPARGGRVPGVGPTGRGPAGAPGAPGGSSKPVAGAGRGAAGRGAWRAACAARTAASCSALSAAARCSAAATSMSWALVGRVAGGGAGMGPFLAALVASPAFDARGAVGLTAVAPFAAEAAGADTGTAPDASIVARSRRATGASIVLEADLTYSPISASLASTVLLSTPSSLASSCTRGLPATTLLIPRSAGSPARPHFGT